MRATLAPPHPTPAASSSAPARSPGVPTAWVARWRPWPVQPFGMAGVVRERFLLTYRVDPRAVRDLLAGPFMPVVREGTAFAGVCLVEMQAMRPAGLPAALGVAYHEAVYRLIVEYDSPTQGRVRGI